MKKLLSIILAALTMMSLFTGCVSGTENSGDEPQPTPTPKVYYQNPLTGEEQAIDYPMGQRPVAVMVNNIMSSNTRESAWPQYGLSKADMLFEMETEGGITRYMAVFRDYNTLVGIFQIKLITTLS